MFNNQIAMKYRIALLPVLMLMAVTTAGAQQTWIFTQILQAALDSHPLIQGRRSAQAAAQSDREGADWQRFPTLSAEANTHNSGVGVLRLEQPLWTGGRITSGIDAAIGRLDAAGAALDETSQELALRVIAGTTEALRQQVRRQHSLAGVKEHEKLLAMIERRVKQEVSPLADQRLAESRLLGATNELSVITQAFNNALTQLTQLSGQPVTVVTERGLSEAGAPVSLDAALTQALAHSPTLRRLGSEEVTADAEIAAKRSVYMPQLALRLENNVNQSFDGRNQNSESRAMLVLSAQPGAGLSAQSGVSAAIARRDTARLAREAAERDIRERVTLDWNELLAARLRLINALQARTMSIEVFESYARQYTTGRKTWIDVLNAVREATQSELAADDAYTQVLAASLRLRALSGTLVTTPVAT